MTCRWYTHLMHVLSHAGQYTPQVFLHSSCFCRVVGNCIAGCNHRFFAGFLISGQLGCLLGLGAAIWRLQQRGITYVHRQELLRASQYAAVHQAIATMSTGAAVIARQHLLERSADHGCVLALPMCALAANCRIACIARSGSKFTSVHACCVIGWRLLCRAGQGNGWELRASYCWWPPWFTATRPPCYYSALCTALRSCVVRNL